ncbi:MAG: hypothetical protein KatS3mg027_0179 [Bacteroidia bacterium]|nr:MAG: hypothetical protein KatS3mg027_0179 [Bacteroidia bacterium]
MINLIRYIWNILTKNLWDVRLEKEKPVVAWIVRYVRIFSLAGRQFIHNKCIIQATALTYYTFFSIVPLVALAFAIAKGFGLEKELEKEILNKNPQYEFVLVNVFDYANKMLSAAKGGIIAGAGVLLLLYSVISLLNNIENVFNQIWGAQKSKSWFRKIADYIAIMIFAPIFLILSSSAVILLRTKMSSILFSSAAVVGINLISLGLLMMIFFFIFKSLTNAFVSVRSAFFGAFWSALFFELLEWLYLHFQIGVSRYNAIYGSFAAVPLFLLFIQYSWFVVLFGAEIVYAHQHVNEFELETGISNLSNRLKKVLCIMVMNKILNLFVKGDKNISIQKIASNLDLPGHLIQNIIQDLIETEFVIEVKQENDDPIYLPFKPDYQISVSELLKALDGKGTNTLPMDETIEYKSSNELISKVEEIVQNNFGHLLVKEVI